VDQANVYCFCRTRKLVESRRIMVCILSLRRVLLTAARNGCRYFGGVGGEIYSRQRWFFEGDETGLSGARTQILFEMDVLN